MAHPISVRGTTTAALQRGVINPFNGSMRTLAHAVIGNFSKVGLRSIMQKVESLQPQPPSTVGYEELLIQNCNTSFVPNSSVHRPIHIYFRRTDLSSPTQWLPIDDSPHDANYDANGLCPADDSAGARISLDDGKTYEVAIIDPLLTGCITGGPDEPACRRWPVITIQGKAGGGVIRVRVT